MLFWKRLGKAEGDLVMATGLSRLLTFSGRASRSEYWRFAVPVLVLLALAFAFDWFVLGPVSYVTHTVSTSLLTGEETQSVTHGTRYGARAATNVTAILVSLPFTAMLTRRVHDIGFPGWYAWVAMFLAFFSGLALLPLAWVASAVSVKLALVLTALTGLPLALLSILAFVFIVIWGATPSEHGENEYGPNPNEVSA